MARHCATPVPDHAARPASTCPIWRRCIGNFRGRSRWYRISSEPARVRWPTAVWIATVPHGLPETAVRVFDPEPGDYSRVRVGRISPEKASTVPIEIAIAIGTPLRIAAKVDRVDRGLLRARDLPLLDDPLIEFVGEIGRTRQNDFLGDAARAAVPDRLARAVRPGDDRGAWPAARRWSPTAAARCRRSSRTASPATSSAIETRRLPRRRRIGSHSSALPVAAHFEQPLHRLTAMAQRYLEVYQALSAAAPTAARRPRRR